MCLLVHLLSDVPHTEVNRYHFESNISVFLGGGSYKLNS